jgi:signal transduction histidine kinase
MTRSWNLQSLSIKVRLRMFFSAVVVLMLIGSILSFWQFRNLSEYASRVSGSEHRITAMLRLNNNLITLMNQLYRAAEKQDPDGFEREANRLLTTFQRQSVETNAALPEIAREGERYAVLVASIQSMLETLPARISSLVHLAQRGDWTALHARLLNQADHTDDVVAALVQQAETDLAGARHRLSEDLHRAQRRAANVLALTAGLSLIAAVLLGALVTHSITRPLAELDAGTRALAAGEFQHRIVIKGRDELAHLAQVFNRTAGELARLFDEVRHQHTIAEAATADLQQHAQELSRANADLQQFAYSASHDLQEPLRVVALYSQLLQRRYGGQLDTDAEEYIGYLLRGARQMQQLITDLLVYTQTTTVDGELESVTDVCVVLQRVLTSVEPQSGTVTADPLPLVKVREIHVQQVLQNLIGNAIKYRSDRHPEIHIWAEPQRDYWLFSVRDNGIGIDPQYSTRIFGIFKRLHGQKYPGTGIGLAICQRIVERYGGRIWVESAPGQGSTFRFTLPAA